MHSDRQLALANVYILGQGNTLYTVACTDSTSKVISIGLVVASSTLFVSLDY